MDAAAATEPDSPLQPVHVAALAERNGWRPEVYGESANGVPLVAWWPQQTPTRVFWAAIHGEESATLQLAHTLLRTVPAQDACAVVVPVANPDGVLLGTRQNARGVDLNRNFPCASWLPDPSPTYWPTTMTRSIEHRTQISSPGSAPGSEPEVAALCALVERVQPWAVVDLHAPLDLVLAISDRSVELAEHIAAPAGLRVERELDKPTPGDSAAWCEEQGAIAVTYEIELGTLPQLWHRHAAGLACAIVDNRPSQPLDL
jgi:protein MpaA